MDTVRKYLVNEGVDPDRLTASGFGETQPIDTNRIYVGARSTAASSSTSSSSGALLSSVNTPTSPNGSVFLGPHRVAVAPIDTARVLTQRTPHPSPPRSAPGG